MVVRPMNLLTEVNSVTRLCRVLVASESAPSVSVDRWGALRAGNKGATWSLGAAGTRTHRRCGVGGARQSPGGEVPARTAPCPGEQLPPTATPAPLPVPHEMALPVSLPLGHCPLVVPLLSACRAGPASTSCFPKPPEPVPVLVPCSCPRTPHPSFTLPLRPLRADLRCPQCAR